MKLYKYEIKKIEELSKVKEKLELSDLWNFETPICSGSYRAGKIYEIARKKFNLERIIFEGQNLINKINNKNKKLCD